MDVDVYVDASYREDHHQGGWGCILETCNKQSSFSGRFKNCPLNSTACEKAAIVNGVYLAKKHHPLLKRITVYSDCLTVHASLRGKSSIYPDYIDKAFSINKGSTVVRIKHVKGHVPIKKASRKELLNRKADNLANKARKGI